MRHLRWALPAAVVLALCASTPAAALDSHDGGAPIVTPANGHDLAEWYKYFNELPAPVNPLWGSGEDPCVRLGNTLVALTFGGVPVTCTAELGTVVNTGGGHFCSTFDPPDSEFYAVGVREQRRCAREVSDRRETGLRLSVDGGPWIDLFQPQFTAYSPLTTVQLPVDNVWGVPAQTATITAYGWHAIIRNLRVGRHEWTVEADDFEGNTYVFPHVVNIVPRRHSEDHD